MENVILATLCKVTIINFTNIYILWKCYNVMLKRQRAKYVFCLFFGMRWIFYIAPTALIKCVDVDLYNHLNFIMGPIWSMLAFVFVYYFWAGDYLKNMFGIVFGEIILIPFASLGLIASNMASGIEELMMYDAFRLEWQILLIPIVSLLSFRLAFGVIKKVLLRYQEYEIKHRVFWWGFMFFYAFFLNFVTAKNIQSVYGRAILVVCFWIVCGGVGIILYRIHLKAERVYLLESQKILETQYQEIQRQIQTMEKMNPKMEAYMELWEKAQAGTGSEQVINDYLNELKDQFQTLRTGIYSNNPMIDAILSHYANVCKEEHIPIEISAWTYCPASTDEMETERRLIKQLEKAVQKNRKLPEEQRGICVTVGTVKGQVIIRIGTGDF